jgi:hypothetical protein
MQNIGYFRFKTNSQVINRLVIIALSVICISLLFRSCEMKHQHSSAIEDLLHEKNGIEKLVDEQGRESAYLKATILTKDKTIQKQLKEISDLKTLDVKLKIKNVTLIDTLVIPLHDTTFIVSNDTIEYQKFSHSDQWFSLNGKVEKKQLIIDSLRIHNEYTIEVGDAKIGLFKKEKRVYVRNENPHTSTEDLKFFILKDERKWYQKDAWKIIGTAVVTTLIIRNI